MGVIGSRPDVEQLKQSQQQSQQQPLPQPQPPEQLSVTISYARDNQNLKKTFDYQGEFTSKLFLQFIDEYSSEFKDKKKFIFGSGGKTQVICRGEQLEKEQEIVEGELIFDYIDEQAIVKIHKKVKKYDLTAYNEKFKQEYQKLQSLKIQEDFSLPPLIEILKEQTNGRQMSKLIYQPLTEQLNQLKQEIGSKIQSQFLSQANIYKEEFQKQIQSSFLEPLEKKLSEQRKIIDNLKKSISEVGPLLIERQNPQSVINSGNLRAHNCSFCIRPLDLENTTIDIATHTHCKIAQDQFTQLEKIHRELSNIYSNDSIRQLKEIATQRFIKITEVEELK